VASDTKPTLFTLKPVRLTAERGRPRKALATRLTGNDLPETMEIAMTHYDSALRAYAVSGLRSAQDWATMGRGIKPESKPRVDTMHRGAVLPLFSRDQTRIVRRDK
jgi:hypothetical protein